MINAVNSYSIPCRASLQSFMALIDAIEIRSILSKLNGINPGGDS